MAEIICPQCQFKNEPDAVYCEDCGALLSVSSEDSGQEVCPENLAPGFVVKNRYEIVSICESGLLEFSYMAIDREEKNAAVWIKARKITSENKEEIQRQKPLLEKIAANPHKNIVGVYSAFIEDDCFFTVCEALEGENLFNIMNVGGTRVTGEHALDWALQIAEGLKFLHSMEILHMDIQPAHLFLTMDGVIKITGFSRICSLSEPSLDNTVTDGYSPPEFYGLMGGLPTAASDIFSMGASIYSFVAGRTAALSRENFFNYASFKDLEIEIDPEFDEIILGTLKKEPSLRVQSVDEVLVQLQKIKEKESLPKSRAKKPLDYEIFALSDIGKVRQQNQDSCLVTRLNAYEKSRRHVAEILVVADGMGGEAEGDRASSMAVRIIANRIMSSFLSPSKEGKTTKLYSEENEFEKCRDILKGAVLKANREVYEFSKKDPSRRGMGSTISAALVVGGYACICHAGDTRVYAVNRRTGLKQITEDHSLVGRLVRMGQMTREEAQNSPQRSAIYRALGTTGDLEVDLYDYLIQPDDYLILCSDGVWEYFLDDELTSIVLKEIRPRKIAERLVQTCLLRGADDNATVIVLHAVEAAGEERTELKPRAEGLLLQMTEPEIPEKPAAEPLKEEVPASSGKKTKKRKSRKKR